MNEEEDIRGGATDEQITQAYKERQILDQQDPRTDEKFLEERAKQKQAEEEDTDEDPTTDKLESRGYKGNRKSIRQRQKEIRQRALADRDSEGSTITRGPGQVFKGGTPDVGSEPPDVDMRTGERIYGNKEDRFGNPLSEFEGNLGASIAFEIGANTLLDLFTPILPLQSGGSYVINLISQIIRDPSKINSLNQLEAGAAAASSLIPGANQYAAYLKGMKPATKGTQLARQIGRGAVTANLDMLGMKIGEGEEVTFQDLTAATILGGSFGGAVGSAPEVIKYAKGKTDDLGDLSKVFRNIRKRIDGTLPKGELITDTGFNFSRATPEPEFEPTTAFAIKGKGEGLTPDEIKRAREDGLTRKEVKQATDISTDEYNKSLEPKSKLEAGTDLETIKKAVEQENRFNQKQYDLAKKSVFEFDEAQPFKVSKADIRKMKVNARRKLKLKDVKKVQAKLNDKNITDEVVQNYYDDAVRSELGYTGTAGTIDFLNLMSDAPSRKAFTSVDEFLANSRVGRSSIEDILDDMSFRLETPISKERLQNLLDGTETYSFQTPRMRKKGEAPILINDIDSLQKAYFARLLALEDIAEFEKGHINAVDQILERFYRGEKITPTASFKDNTNPEIARSIYKLVGNEAAFDAMSDINKDYIVKGLTDRELKFAQVFAGNRSRKANQDLDRVVNSIFGTEPDLESSLLSYVYPERSLNAMVDPSMKVTFAQVYMKELDELVQALLDAGAKMEDIGPNVLEGYRQRALETPLQSFPPDLSKDMGKMLDAYLKANKIDVVDPFGEPKF